MEIASDSKGDDARREVCTPSCSFRGIRRKLCTPHSAFVSNEGAYPITSPVPQHRVTILTTGHQQIGAITF